MGALLGSYSFGPIASSGPHGMAWVFVICTAVSVLGLACTHFFLEPYSRETLLGCRRRRRSSASALSAADGAAPLAEPLSG